MSDSMLGCFSSTTKISSRPRAKFRARWGLNGMGMCMHMSRIPAAEISASSPSPSRRRASRSSR